MDLEVCKRKIDRYLKKENVQPLIVDVQNQEDLSEIIMHYNVGSNKVISVSNYCNMDGIPHMETLFHDLEIKNEVIFVTGISSFLKLQGEMELRKTLNQLLSMPTAGHVVIVTFQCKKFLDYDDPRLPTRIFIVDGAETKIPELVFLKPALPKPKNAIILKGIHNFAEYIEKYSTEKVYIITEKKKDTFPCSLYSITGLSKAYDMLILKDPMTANLEETYGTDKQWEFALDLINEKGKWVTAIDYEFGSHLTLELTAPSYNNYCISKKWLFYIALKLYGAKNNWCLNAAIKKSTSINDFFQQIYRCILEIDTNDKNFWHCYETRKILLKQLDNPSEELRNYCEVVKGKRKKAIYYLTDNTQKEKEEIFSILDEFGLDYDREELNNILQKVYPALYNYLQPYRFKNDLLNGYFQDYKYQKVINKILPEFESAVKAQAEKREYNLLLEPRSSKIETLNRENSELYFMDAMGVEYLGYILAVCKELKLIANIIVCRSELPSITCKNKEFVDLFTNELRPVNLVKDIDEIKHHGKYNYDYYRNSKLPIHLMRELDIIREALGKIKDKLVSGDIAKAFMIADHGASRLAVLHDTENVWEMSKKGEHSGRCCPKSDLDIQPDFATDAGDFWALANYDCFKGGRKANVEVHGGATLEEVCVPIIELTYYDQKIEAYLMTIDTEVVDFNHIPEVEVSFRKKAALKIFTSVKLYNVGIMVKGKYFEAEELGNNFYRVDMPEIKIPNTYYADVYTGDNRIAEQLPFIIRKEGSQEKELL